MALPCFLALWQVSKGSDKHCAVGVPGDELGYVVKMGSDDVQYDIRPGTKVDLVSEYDASEIRLGMASLPDNGSIPQLHLITRLGTR